MKDTYNFTLVDDAGEEVEHDLPGKFEICNRCEGRGTHVNPAIDGNGLTREDFAEDPDFAEDYMRGAYDVACHVCGGARVVMMPDVDRCSVEQLQALERSRNIKAEIARDDASEERLRMMESGERW